VIAPLSEEDGGGFPAMVPELPEPADAGGLACIEIQLTAES
jgi:hypothetical protein